jgi:hypothetical protein
MEEEEGDGVEGDEVKRGREGGFMWRRDRRDRERG